MQYFGEEVTEDTTCQTLGSALCDNCSFHLSQPTQISKANDFHVVVDAIRDLPEHGIQKVHCNYTSVLLKPNEYNLGIA